MAICHCHDLGRFAASSPPNKRAPFFFAPAWLPPMKGDAESVKGFLGQELAHGRHPLDHRAAHRARAQPARVSPSRRSLRPHILTPARGRGPGKAHEPHGQHQNVFEIPGVAVMNRQVDVGASSPHRSPYLLATSKREASWTRRAESRRKPTRRPRRATPDRAVAWARQSGSRRPRGIQSAGAGSGERRRVEELGPFIRQVPHHLMQSCRPRNGAEPAPPSSGQRPLGASGWHPRSRIATRRSPFR